MTKKWRALYAEIPPDHRACNEAEVAQDLAKMAPPEDQQAAEPGGATFLKRVEALKRRYGGGVSDFEPQRLDFVPAEPFSRKRTRRA